MAFPGYFIYNNLPVSGINTTYGRLWDAWVIAERRFMGGGVKTSRRNNQGKGYKTIICPQTWKKISTMGPSISSQAFHVAR